jgi:hypothetical protein
MSVIGAASFEVAATYSKSLDTVVTIGGLAEAPSSYSSPLVLTTACSERMRVAAARGTFRRSPGNAQTKFSSLTAVG